MKNRAAHFSFWLASILTATLVAAAPTEFRLETICSDNMVLQEGCEHGFRGKAAPKAKLQVTYKGKTGRTTANPDGDWKLNLNLSKVKNGAPANLEFSEIPAKQPVPLKVFTNVAIGKVWGLGVLGYGIPVHSNKIASVTNPSRIRFADYAELADHRPWMSLAPDADTANRLNAFSLEAARELGDEYIGIVQFTPSALRELGSQDKPGADAAIRRAELRKKLDRLKDRCNGEVAKELEARRDRLIRAKHDGDVVTLPLPHPYVFSTVLMRKEFSPTEPRLKEFNFDWLYW